MDCLFAFLLMSFGEQYFNFEKKSGQYLIEWLVIFIFFTKKSLSTPTPKK